MPTHEQIIRALEAAYFIRGFLYGKTDINTSKFINCIIDVLNDLYINHDCNKKNINLVFDNILADMKVVAEDIDRFGYDDDSRTVYQAIVEIIEKNKKEV